MPRFNSSGGAAARAWNNSAGDRYFGNVTLLLHCDGADGSTAFPDNSRSNRTMVANSCDVTTALKKYGTGGLEMSGGWLSSANDADDELGSGDFTLEAWLYPTTSTGGATPPTWASRWNSAGAGNNQWVAYLSTLTPVIAVSTSGVTTTHQATGPAATINAWNHIACVRRAGVLQVFTNGVGGATVAIAGSLHVDSNPLLIGTFSGAGGATFQGAIDEVRFTKGVARYAANFSPPSKAFPNF